MAPMELGYSWFASTDIKGRMLTGVVKIEYKNTDQYYPKLLT